MDIDAADHAGIAPKAAHVFSGEVVGGTSNLGYTHFLLEWPLESLSGIALCVHLLFLP
jgi:hypothetical protein